MGIGQYPAGGYPNGPFTPVGFDPVWVGTPPVPPPTFRAIAFDPHTRTFVFNADGSVFDVHPVDQRVVLLLWIPQGQLGSASGVGTRIKKRIARVARASIPNIVNDEVRRVLAPLIAAGDVQFLKTIVDNSVAGRTEYAVFYKNLRDTSDNRTRALNTANGQLTLQ